MILGFKMEGKDEVGCKHLLKVLKVHILQAPFIIPVLADLTHTHSILKGWSFLLAKGKDPQM